MVHPEGTIQHQMLDILAAWSNQLSANGTYDFDPLLANFALELSKKTER